MDPTSDGMLEESVDGSEPAPYRLVDHRYNKVLPPSYVEQIRGEQVLILRALRSLANSILNSREAGENESEGACLKGEESPEAERMWLQNALVSEGYQHEFERDLAALEKGITRYLDLKHPLEENDYPQFVNIFLRAALSPTVDMGLRSKLTRCVSRLLAKRNCKLPDGIPWRVIMRRITEAHISTMEGGPFIGRDVRDSHCRNFTSLLAKCRNFLTPDDSAEKIWNEFQPKLRTNDPDEKFKQALIMSYVLPTLGSSWSGWISSGIDFWKSIESSSDWDSIWMGLFGRLTRDQPCLYDWTPHLQWFYSRITSAFRLPLGTMAPYGANDRRCPSPFYFLMSGRTIPSAAAFIVYSLSPKHPKSFEHLERLFALIANYFHPSNSGRWSSTIGSFLVHISANLVARVTDERACMKAGIVERIIGDRQQHGVAPNEHRLTESLIGKLVDLMFPLVQHGLHSKVGVLSAQSASAARDLALIQPDRVLRTFLTEALEALGSISSPHRTRAALRLLSSLAPVFIDPDIFPDGRTYLIQALEMALPGIDPNDPGKTESTLRFIAGASARLQNIGASDRADGMADFLEEYVPLVLDRIFSLLESMEAPSKKNTISSHRHGGPQLSYFIFSFAVENLFVALPPQIAISGAQRISRQLTAAACMNGMKYYGALVRTSASAAAAANEGSAVSLFVPKLIDSILEESSISGEEKCYTLVTISDDELVWRVRMLAQACRSCGSGLEPFLDKISRIIRLAFDKPSRPIYKAGGRLLRGVLEGLSSTHMLFDSEDVDPLQKLAPDNTSFEWRVPSNREWRQAENFLTEFVQRAEELCLRGDDMRSDDKSIGSVTSDRDALFRGLRLLHAIQRGGRWLLGGAQPERFKRLDAHLDGECEISKGDAKLILKRPVLAGFGGERSPSEAWDFAVEIWTRVYSLTSRIISKVLSTRPDDGALLYRCLEPLELAHEPFRRGERSRQTMHAARAYKGAYKSVVGSKRPFGAEGGVGRAMPRFILRLRVEAHHEMRQSIAAHGGISAPEVCESLVRQLTELALNDFPRVRVEARGVLTRALRIVRPWVRRQEAIRIIRLLRDAYRGSEVADGDTNAEIRSASFHPSVDVPEQGGPKNGHNSGSPRADAKGSLDATNIFYEKMIGAAAILRSTAVAPLIMRDVELYSEVVRALLHVLPNAERADGVNAVTALFAKLSSLVRPHGLNPIRLLRRDLISPLEICTSTSEEAHRVRKAKTFADLNCYLLQLLHTSPLPDVLNGSSDASPTNSTYSSKDAHWRLQVLVATVLYINLREDRPPPAQVAKFFAEEMVSEVVTLRHISLKAVMLILAMHGRKAGSSDVQGDGSIDFWSARGVQAVSAIGSVVMSTDFTRNLVNILALDHEDADGGGRRSLGMIEGAGGAIAFMNLSRTCDGDVSWMMTAGRPWPVSWHPRARDNMNIVRMRFYESFSRVFGMQFYNGIFPLLKELVEKVKAHEEKIISGVKDEDIKVLTAEILAGVCRGLDISREDGGASSTLQKVAISLLHELSGPVGNVTGGTLIRLISTAEKHTVGSKVAEAILGWVLEQKPVVVPMGSGPVAHLQARRLRYIHSCVADIENCDDPRLLQVMQGAMHALFAEVGFGHEMKAVREEVSRCLASIAADVPPGFEETFCEEVTLLVRRLETKEQKHDDDIDMDKADASDLKDADPYASETRKSRSRQGETLSRMVTMLHWNGRSKSFHKHTVLVLRALFTSLDESDPERISHARQALSLAAQAPYSSDLIGEVVSVVEETIRDSRWKVRGSVLAFLQVMSFISLFMAHPESQHRIRTIVMTLLEDTQLEIRQAAAASFVTMIRDASKEAVETARNQFMKMLKETTPRGRGKKRQPMEADTIRRRHGAVLGLSSMVVCSPYAIPLWMPSVLVGLSGCVNDPPPISTGVRKLFADFMRTHRDEWQMHKLAFTPDELEIVSELLVSPSYYA